MVQSRNQKQAMSSILDVEYGSKEGLVILLGFHDLITITVYVYPLGINLNKYIK